MKTVQQIMEESNAKANMEAFMEMQQWPYALKIRHARQVAGAFWENAPGQLLGQLSMEEWYEGA